MATKKSTPKKTNTKTKTSVARTAGKGFDAGLKSTLGNDPKPYNRRNTSGTKTSTPKTSDASTARGQRLNSSASMPKGKKDLPIDTTHGGRRVTEPLTSNKKRFLPVDAGAAGELPAGATSAKYDSYTGKFVPVYNSGSKKNSKKDLPRDYGL